MNIKELFKDAPYTLNKVENFNPYQYVVLSTEDDELNTDEVGNPQYYLPTNAKKTWFKLKHPDGAIRSEDQVKSILDSEMNNDGSLKSAYEIFHAFVYADRKEPYTMAEGHCKKTRAGDRSSTFASAETIAIGRALSNAGFGCEVESYIKLISSKDGNDYEEDISKENHQQNNHDSDGKSKSIESKATKNKKNMFENNDSEVLYEKHKTDSCVSGGNDKPQSVESTRNSLLETDINNNLKSNVTESTSDDNEKHDVDDESAEQSVSNRDTVPSTKPEVKNAKEDEIKSNDKTEPSIEVHKSPRDTEFGTIETAPKNLKNLKGKTVGQVLDESDDRIKTLTKPKIYKSLDEKTQMAIDQINEEAS